MTTSHKQSNKNFTLWPYAVVVCMVLFMGYIASFVYKAMNQDVDLVSKNYYEQEIAYQEHIDKVGRTAAIGNVAITYNEQNRSVLLQLPETLKGKQVKGKITLFRPSDDQLDQELPLQLGRDMSQLIETQDLERGLWKVRVNFNEGEQTYYTEKTIQLK
ncbi:nitrogen fixation protein FixH [Pontibacter qinzhouensis]|uniref:Nitrogen fixation protein FixH n=1 Tax=Pontibacter qinzhouensis TaxID=2603253 RepID=A0A5C8J7L5_9BACT|nr:FixH family protein [Pontibacter qinzhouensis]TXK33276.1 nitrogen fixation protein FixH [Pontibacter qinzhouensis]